MIKDSINYYTGFDKDGKRKEYDSFSAFIRELRGKEMKMPGTVCDPYRRTSVLVETARSLKTVLNFRFIAWCLWNSPKLIKELYCLIWRNN